MQLKGVRDCAFHE